MGELNELKRRFGRRLVRTVSEDRARVSLRAKGTKKRGSALTVVLATMTLLTVASASYISSSTSSIVTAQHDTYTVLSYHLCDAAAQEEMLNLWLPFQTAQNFNAMDALCTGASASAPAASLNDSISGVGNFSAGVTSYSVVDSYTRNMTIRTVGWIDVLGTGALSAGDPRRIMDVNVTYQLARSQVFDYTYFVNNYGWMDGFGPNDLIVNGDMRANGDFSFTNGTPTVNGSVYATYNNLLIPAAQGQVSGQMQKWSNSTYATSAASQSRWRQGYQSSQEGAVGSSTYNQWAPFIFDANGSIQGSQLDGAVLADSTGVKSWQYNSNQPWTTTVLDPTPTSQVIMPDLSNISVYQSESQSYVDQKANFQDGTPNPNFGKGAYLQTWNSTTNSYQTITTNGCVTGSAGIIGTQAHPIVIHGPVTFSQDCAIQGYVSGQGTIYTGRNVHIVGSILYSNPPDFRGNNMQTVDQSNEHKDFLGLAARASIIMGDVSQFNNSYPLPYMEPPFTHPRYDENGNLIPAYNAVSKDSTGFMLYQSVLGNNYIHSIAQPVNEIDAIMYTNFVGGGDIATGGSGVTINGSIISKDEAMVVWSLPMRENYDNRIKERSLTQQPLIDLVLPRSPTVTTNTTQDQGFSMGG